MRIGCPECGQKFDVTEDFLGKTVECGACDGRFKVTTNEIVVEKTKFYPGEKTESHLEVFGRNPHETVANVAFPEAHYQEGVDADDIGPVRPRQTLAVIGGIAFMTLIIVIFLLAGGKEGSMRDMETMNRFVLCGFSALVGGALVLYGMHHNKRLGLLLAVIFAGVLLSLPVLFPGNPISASVQSIAVADDTGDGELIDSERANDSYLFEIGYDPIADAITKHPKESVVGIFLRNPGEIARGKIAKYIYNATDMVSRETVYKRGETANHALIVLVDQKKSIEEIATLCLTFGRIKKIDKDLRLIDVIVERAKISSLDRSKVIDPESLDYEIQNLKALKSFDRKEQSNAVRRLANSKPRALRDDITSQLIKMLPVSDPDMQLEIIEALKTWASPESGAGPVVLEAVKKLHVTGDVSKTSMELLIAHHVDGCQDILMDLWNKDPAGWSDVMILLADGAEVVLLPQIKGMDAAHTMAASDILGKVGTKACMEFLQSLIPSLDEQKQKSLQAAIDEIKKRS